MHLIREQTTDKPLFRQVYPDINAQPGPSSSSASGPKGNRHTAKKKGQNGTTGKRKLTSCSTTQSGNPPKIKHGLARCWPGYWL
jgi:hypothetical protein